MELKRLAITGISTEIGKTICSAIFCEALKADYWKPIQSGDLDYSDSDKVRDLISNSASIVHPETYRLKTPMSPHASADIDKIHIEMDQLIPPSTDNTLVIEPAGGLMVPLNEKDLYIDYIQKLQIPVVLVSKYYLGSINHTLLSVALLKSRNIETIGIVFNGKKVPSSHDIILKQSGLPCLLEIDQEEELGPEIVKKYASRLSIGASYPV